MPDIKAMSDRDHVFLRPGMYIGSTENPSIAVREIIDNSIDEILAGRASSIWVYSDKLDLGPNKKFTRYVVADDGSGIPIKATTNLAGEEVTMADLGTGSLRAGSKFNKTEIQSGLNGVGSSAINFLSEEFHVYSRLSLADISLTTKKVKDMIDKIGMPKSKYKEYYYKVSYNQGIREKEEIVKLADDEIGFHFIKGEVNEDGESLDIYPSTITYFIPHHEIWHTQECKIPLNTRYLKYMMNEKGVDTHFYINDVENKDTPKKYEYSFTCRINNPEKDTKNDFMEFYASIGISDNLMEYDLDYSVNTLSTQQGHHTSLFRRSWEAATQAVFGDQCKGYAHLGINVLCIFTCPEPAFASQTKERLSDIPGFPLYNEYTDLTKAMIKVIKDNYDAFAQNAARIREYIASMDNWSRLNQIKSMLSVGSDLGGKAGSSAFKPRKLRDCMNPNRLDCELYIIEGSSAAGSMVKARAGKDNIAILPLKGRPLNVSGMDITDVLENDEMYDIINAVGVGVNDYHDTSQIRYGKIIIATDGDSDGFAIAALVLNCIVHHLTFLLDEGFVYIACAPLYEDTVTHKFYYAGDEDKMREETEGHYVQRYKGLGEQGADSLGRAMYDPNTRKLIKVTKDNLDEAMALCSSTIARQHLMLSEKVITDDVLNENTVNTVFTDSFIA